MSCTGKEKNVDFFLEQTRILELEQTRILETWNIHSVAAVLQSSSVRVGLTAAKTAAMRINLNIDGCGVVAPPVHSSSRAECRTYKFAILCYDHCKTMFSIIHGSVLHVSKYDKNGLLPNRGPLMHIDIVCMYIKFKPAEFQLSSRERWSTTRVYYY